MNTKILELIQEISRGSASLNAAKTDDNVAVFYRRQFDVETGTPLPSQVVGSISSEDLVGLRVQLETDAVRVSEFIASLDLGDVVEKRVTSRTAVQKAFLDVLGPSRGISTWAWVWRQAVDPTGHPAIAYWVSFLTLAEAGVDVHSVDLLSALNLLREIDAPNGQPVLGEGEPEQIAGRIAALTT